ncbi:MAG: regulatory protein RecX [Gammaproteobacteria bacterium]|jgi:regulatory protein
MTEQEVRNVAIKLLAQREHSRYELQSKLLIRKYDRAVIEKVLDELSQTNLQSDIRFAQSYTRMKMARGFGPIRIRQELHDRGIADDLIEECLAISLDAWMQEIIKVRSKKFGSDVPHDYEERAKQMRFLQYRGFTTEQIKRGMRSIDENS